MLLGRRLTDRITSRFSRRAVRRTGGGVLATVLAVSVIVPAATSQAAASATPTVAKQAKHHLVRAKAHKQARHKQLKQKRRASTLLDLVNAARAQGRRCGGTYYPRARPLRYNDNLSDAARKFARDLGRHGYFSHTGRSGSTPTSRARAEGYRGYAGENIAAGRATGRATMRDWLASPGHCANIMSAQYRFLGVGYASVAGSPYGTYWVQDFGLR